MGSLKGVLYKEIDKKGGTVNVGNEIARFCISNRLSNNSSHRCMYLTINKSLTLELLKIYSLFAGSG